MINYKIFKLGFVVSLLLGLFLSFSLIAKEKVIYKYKQYEKFDFNALNIEGGKGGLSDLSLIRRGQKKFKYKMPYRKNFFPEMLKSVKRVR